MDGSRRLWAEHIRGRSNSTGLPKKTIQTELDEDASILGLAKEKDWVFWQIT